jgi:hypothetical protein
MTERFTILLKLLFISSIILTAGAVPPTLREGMSLAGIDGKLTEEQDKWFFELESDLTDGEAFVRAGQKIQLLPSATLEKMTADAEKRATTGYRIWGTVTQYQHANFIFPLYFLPLSKVIDANEHTEQQSQRQTPDITINEPNDKLPIPQEIINLLKPARLARTEEIGKGMELKQDVILADRTATLACDSDETFRFVLDAPGRNVPTVSFKLLPCQVLQQAQAIQSARAEPVRFKIAAILTRYKGENCLLLQRATRLYSHQNFDR